MVIYVMYLNQSLAVFVRYQCASKRQLNGVSNSKIGAKLTHRDHWLSDITLAQDLLAHALFAPEIIYTGRTAIALQLDFRLPFSGSLRLSGVKQWIDETTVA